MNLTWMFHNFGETILGKNQEFNGILQISTAFRNESSSNIETLLCEFASLTSAKDIELKIKEIDSYKLGFFDLIVDGKITRYWNILKPEGLIFATYSNSKEKLITEEINDCEYILLNNSF
jgi:hypothetical protein